MYSSRFVVNVGCLALAGLIGNTVVLLFGGVLGVFTAWAVKILQNLNVRLDLQDNVGQEN